MVRKCFVFSTVNNSVAFRRFSTPTQRSMEPVNQRTAANSRRNPLFSDPINGRAATDISRESLPPPEPMRWKAYRAKPSRSRSHDAIILEVYGARGDPKTFGGFSGLAAFWGKAPLPADKGNLWDASAGRQRGVTGDLRRWRECARW